MHSFDTRSYTTASRVNAPPLHDKLLQGIHNMQSVSMQNWHDNYGALRMRSQTMFTISSTEEIDYTMRWVNYSRDDLWQLTVQCWKWRQFKELIVNYCDYTMRCICQPYLCYLSMLVRSCVSTEAKDACNASTYLIWHILNAGNEREKKTQLPNRAEEKK